MDEYLKLTVKVVSFVVTPVLVVVRLAYRLVVAAINPFWNAVHFLFLPVIHLFRFFFAIVTYPLTVDVRSTIEPLYIFLGIAGLIGIAAGIALHLTFALLSPIIGASPRHEEDKGRTVASYRAERRVKKELDANPPRLTGGNIEPENWARQFSNFAGAPEHSQRQRIL